MGKKKEFKTKGIKDRTEELKAATENKNYEKLEKLLLSGQYNI